MTESTIKKYLSQLIRRYPALRNCRADIAAAFTMLVECFAGSGKLLVCGNGGSAADADHIVGELMKNFRLSRSLDETFKARLHASACGRSRWLAETLQPALPALALGHQTALCTAIANDIDARLVFAQQVFGYGRPGDVMLGISTSGNAENVIAALLTARALGLRTIGLTGECGGAMREFCDITICVAGRETFAVQELHLPVYHALCQMLEWHFYHPGEQISPSEKESDAYEMHRPPDAA